MIEVIVFDSHDFRQNLKNSSTLNHKILKLVIIKREVYSTC